MWKENKWSSVENVQNYFLKYKFCSKFDKHNYLNILYSQEKGRYVDFSIFEIVMAILEIAKIFENSNNRISHLVIVKRIVWLHVSWGIIKWNWTILHLRETFFCQIHIFYYLITFKFVGIMATLAHIKNQSLKLGKLTSF